MVTALPLRVTLAVAGGLGMALAAGWWSIFMPPISPFDWARLAVASRVQQAAVARERRNIGWSLFLGGWRDIQKDIDWTLMAMDLMSVMLLSYGGVGCQPVAINARLEERARSSAG